MPNVTFSWEIRIIESSIAWLATNLPSSVVSKRIVEKLLVRPHIRSAICRRILSRIVDQHCRVHVFSDSLLKILQSLSELSRVFRHSQKSLEFFSGNSNIVMIIVRIASVFINGPLSFSAKDATK